MELSRRNLQAAFAGGAGSASAAPSSSAEPGPCEYCGGYHPNRICPRIKAIEYGADGLPARIEFFAPIDYPQKVDAAGVAEPAYPTLAGGGTDAKG